MSRQYFAGSITVQKRSKNGFGNTAEMYLCCWYWIRDKIVDKNTVFPQK